MDLNTISHRTLNTFTTFIETNDYCQDILLSHRIIDSGLPNRYGCRVPLHSNWNLTLMKQLLHEYHDIEIIDWLMFGFSISRNDYAADPVPATCNHAGANLFPQAVDDYIRKEIRLGATMGPFKVPPYINRIGVSPLSTRPKRGTSARRIILDLSFPPQYSVNSAIDKNFYCGAPIKLVYPTVDDLCRRVADLGSMCLLWKRDLSRFFRQLPLCPRDYPLISYRWRNLIYIDKYMPMGLTSAAYVAQRTTTAIKYIHNTLGYWSINYLDDFGSAEAVEHAWQSYILMGRILSSIGVDEASEKAVPPTTRMEFLGNILDSETMTIEVTNERKIELLDLLNRWESRSFFKKKELQSLIGKLSFVTNCVRAGRLFLSRLIDALTECSDQGHNVINEEMKKDIQWWIQFLPTFEGVSMIWLLDRCGYDEQLTSDASLVGGGATFQTQMVHFKFNQQLLDNTSNIAQRELFTTLVALRIWAPELTGQVVRFYTDNQNSMYAVNRGRSNDKFMLACLREIVSITAKHQILLRCRFISTRQNTLPDALSRWYITADARRTVRRLTNKNWRRRSINNELIKLPI